MEHEDYNVVPDDRYPMVVIKRKGSGPVPKELRGMFRTHQQAFSHIDSYLRVKKGKSNAKSSGSSTD